MVNLLKTPRCLLITHTSRKSAWEHFGFKNLELERNADHSGREFWGWILGGGRGAETLEKQGWKFNGKTCWNNSLRNLWAVLLKFARPNQKNSTHIRSAKRRDQHLRVCDLNPITHRGIAQSGPVSYPFPWNATPSMHLSGTTRIPDEFPEFQWKSATVTITYTRQMRSNL